MSHLVPRTVAAEYLPRVLKLPLASDLSRLRTLDLLLGGAAQRAGAAAVAALGQRHAVDGAGQAQLDQALALRFLDCVDGEHALFEDALLELLLLRRRRWSAAGRPGGRRSPRRGRSARPGSAGRTSRWGPATSTSPEIGLMLNDLPITGGGGGGSAGVWTSAATLTVSPEALVATERTTYSEFGSRPVDGRRHGVVGEVRPDGLLRGLGERERRGRSSRPRCRTRSASSSAARAG